MFKKGDSCFHPDYGNGQIVRVNKQNMARIQFDGESEPVWIAMANLEQALPADEAAEYQAQLKKDADQKRDFNGEIKAEKPYERQGSKHQAYTLPATSHATLPAGDEAGITKPSNSVGERTGGQPPSAVVSPVTLRDMVMPAPNLQYFCDKYMQCISAEISESRNRFRLRRMLIHHAEKIQDSAESTIYAIELDSEAFYQEGAEITLWERRNSALPLGKACVASCDGTLMLIEANTEFPDELSGMYYSVDEAALLEALNERLEELKEKEISGLLNDLLIHPKKYIQNHPVIPEQMGQQNALNSALRRPITFIWGPPGTGKTETLARIVLAHLAKGNRVLMLSQCNVSVDAAILRVQQLDTVHQEGQCVRFGYPRDPALTENSDLTVSLIALKNNYERYNQRNSLLRELKKTPHTNPLYLEIRKKLEKITESLMQEEKVIVKKAQFIATTVSKAVIDKTLYKDTFDVVLFDEASMALVPQVIFAASLAKTHFVCAGDFAQLPPITRANRSALEGDIYLYTGISNAVQSNNSHQWLTLLDTQYRMHPDIAEFASRYMYRGLLKHAQVTSQREDIAKCRPVSGEAMCLLNLTGAGITPVDSSKITLMSALMSFGVALHVASQKESVGIITPYSPQSRLLRCMAKDFSLSELAAPGITCSTVHQFQGSEKDVILYDVTETANAGIMLVKSENNYANRLFNVAMTRARGKLCIVADSGFVCHRLPQNLMLTALVKKYEHHCVNLRKQFAGAVCTFPYSIMRAFTDDALFSEIRSDIGYSNTSISMTVSGIAVDILKSNHIIDDVIQRQSDIRLKTILKVPNPGIFGLYGPLFSRSESADNVIILDKHILWYLYILENGLMAGIRFVGVNTVRRIQGVYFH